KVSIVASVVSALLHFLIPCVGIFFCVTPTTASVALSLHDALPIFHRRSRNGFRDAEADAVSGCSISARISTVSARRGPGRHGGEDRKSTRLNSSHVKTSYAVFCLKKKKKDQSQHRK